MKNNLVIAILFVALVAIIGYMTLSTSAPKQTVNDSQKTTVTVYKSPTCGCCGVWASYMEGEGYKIVSENVQDMSEIKERLGIPYELESCHTAEVEGYVIEGHIPSEAIEKLLSERPEIKGIGMAGMPSGSPGMPGPKNEPFVIYEINNDGTRGDIFVTI